MKPVKILLLTGVQWVSVVTEALRSPQNVLMKVEQLE